MQDLTDFLQPVDLNEITQDQDFNDGQWARQMAVNSGYIPDLTDIPIVLLGVGDRRGAGVDTDVHSAPLAIRRALYGLHAWHEEIRVADLGDIRRGATLNDTYVALSTVITEMLRMNKTVVILGGSHDLTLAQYQAYRPLNQSIEATCIDAHIDLKGESPLRKDNFLMEMLTSEPNWVKHYNHIAFQSYYIHPRLLETLEKLRFDCYRVGVVREDLEEMEPVMRASSMVSFDLNAISHAFVPSNLHQPNGLSGDEACALAQYAGMSTQLSSFGLYGYEPEQDPHHRGAMQIAQMIWYFIDGRHKSLQESALQDSTQFNHFHTFFSDVETLFLQSRRSSRWWMQMPGKEFIACSVKDYQKASNNEIPERWLRAQERLA